MNTREDLQRRIAEQGVESGETVVIEFWIPGEPVAWARMSGGKSVHLFEPKKQRDYRPYIRMAAANSMGVRKPLDGEITLSAVFVFPRPKSHYRTGRQSGILRVDAPLSHTSRPDLSNLIKLVEDALNGVIWTDDSHICAYHSVVKVYGERPGVRVKVEDGGGDD